MTTLEATRLPLGGQIKRRDIREYRAALLRDPCAYCGARSEVLDHVHAMFHGGDSSVDNLTGACWLCNSSKNRRSLLGYLGYRAARVRERLSEIRAEASAWIELGARPATRKTKAMGQEAASWRAQT